MNNGWYWNVGLRDPKLAKRYSLVELRIGARAGRVVVPTGWACISPLPAAEAGDPVACGLFLDDPSLGERAAAILVARAPRVAGVEAVEVATRLVVREGLNLRAFAERGADDFEAEGRSSSRVALVRVLGDSDQWCCLVASAPSERWQALATPMAAAQRALQLFPEWAEESADVAF